MVDYLSGFGKFPVLVSLYMGKCATVGCVEYSVWSGSVLSSPPDKSSPKPAFLPLRVERGVAVYHYFFDSVLHMILAMYRYRILRRNGVEEVYSVTGLDSGFDGILAMGTPAFNIKGC